MEEQRPGPVCDQPRCPLRTNDSKHEQRCLPPLTFVKVRQPFHRPSTIFFNVDLATSWLVNHFRSNTYDSIGILFFGEQDFLSFL